HQVNAFDYYESLSALNPSAYMFYFPSKYGVVLGSSPEFLLKIKKREIYLAPIAGTRNLENNCDLLALESRTSEIENEFLKNAMMMLVDGKSFEEIHESMEIQTEQLEEHYKECAEYWIVFGETCPTMGLVGAVFGLILALKLLDNPQAMAAGISGAFTATVTGIFGAYALFAPWGKKLKANGMDLVKEQILLTG
ncbi:MotA/TolQ/ExbB proton channel family protein, partial [Campylobacter jejuni]|uniref:MotA/TolQ/ExbB proton channel family protein n=1 Tax=Campylobacter jejuni TaxID=197 RepID=UPI00207BB825